MKSHPIARSSHLLVLCSLVLSACGASPLLNHKVSGETPLSPVVEPIQAGDPGSESPCEFDFRNQDLCARLTWVKFPNREDTGAFTLSFWAKSKPGVLVQPLADQVAVKLWMPDMGHGSSPVKVRPARDGNGAALLGLYDATGVYFVMPGKWEIFVQLKDAQNVVVDSAKINHEAQ